MEPRDREQDENRLGPDRLDRWLDAALHEYGSAEPRMGLEGRVLANLAAERARGGVRQRWWVYGVVAAAACLGVVVWIDATHRPAVDYVAGNPRSVGQTLGASRQEPAVKRPVVEAVRRRVRPYAAKKIEMAAEPRLSQFPSPRGLSEQEQLLVRYVTESPDEAVLVAKEQAEWRRQVIEGDGSSDMRYENSNQEER